MGVYGIKIQILWRLWRRNGPNGPTLDVYDDDDDDDGYKFLCIPSLLLMNVEIRTTRR
jgi:hypothetical protein